MGLTLSLVIAPFACPLALAEEGAEEAELSKRHKTSGTGLGQRYHQLVVFREPRHRFHAL